MSAPETIGRDLSFRIHGRELKPPCGSALHYWTPNHELDRAETAVRWLQHDTSVWVKYLKSSENTLFIKKMDQAG
ncbi:hypothetical protein AGOR_G00008550 [Albula goreensis]|uniref:Uncharacterized protein n=1 Tax=Albula goreensis TaxID=1534307 RepID=A0A8T3E939_9TELE|nr:hypothetical protein AGOR_G00008550 [Albula goreensis]